MSRVPKVQKIKTKEQMDAVLAASQADNDGCVYPSHVVMKNGEIVGSASIAVLPVLMLWHHSEKIGPRESMQLQNTYEAIMEERGVNQYIILCNKNSPYNSHMKAFGYENVWETEVFTKGLNLNVPA